MRGQYLNPKYARQAGIGLLELLISMAIGLFILAGVMQLLATSTQNTASVEGMSRIQENARYVFNRLEQDMAQAGYLGCFSMSGVNKQRITNVLENDAAAGELFDFNQYIDGENDTVVGANNTDTIIVRYATAAKRHSIVSASGTTVTLKNGAGLGFEPNQVVIAGDCSRVAVFGLSAVNDDVLNYAGGLNKSTDLETKLQGTADSNLLIEGTSLSFVYGGATAVEYRVGARDGNVCDAGNAQNCVLTRAGDEIVEGVEDFQVQYGWQDGGTLFFADADDVSAADWDQVDRVKVTITFNSIENAPTNTGSNLITRTYSRVFLIQNQLPVTS